MTLGLDKKKRYMDTSKHFDQSLYQNTVEQEPSRLFLSVLLFVVDASVEMSACILVPFHFLQPQSHILCIFTLCFQDIYFNVFVSVLQSLTLFSLSISPIFFLEPFHQSPLLLIVVLHISQSCTQDDTHKLV